MPLLIPGDPLEAYYYTHFFASTIHDMEISESMNRNFWQKSFEGPSQSNSCVRHAVMALGATHWHYTMCHPSTAANNDAFTLRHYNQAISGLIHKHSCANLSTADLITVLTCCVSFALLESLRGNYDEAIRHIRSGTELIANHKPTTYLPHCDIEEMVRIFHAISSQVGLFSETRLFADITPFLAPKKKQSRPAAKLRNLIEAEDMLNTFDDVIGHISWDLNDDWDDETSECNKQWESLKQRLENWNDQFTAIVKGLEESGQYANNLERIVNLKIQYKLWELLLEEDCISDDCDKPHTAQLGADECSALLDDLDRLWSKTERPFYGLKTDLTTALYQLYVFCTDENVRLRIIGMLRSRRRREILWDSQALANFLELDMARRALGWQTERWPDIGPSPCDDALIVFKT